MILDNKPLTSITEDDLKSLVIDQVCEGLNLEYKLLVSDGSDKDKKEFLADVSSFANSGGGFLVIGIQDEDGVAKALVGIKADPDSEILKIESIIRDGLRPIIQGIQTHSVKLSNNDHIFIIKIPNSLNKPHQIVYQKDYRFYTRSSNGKYLIEVEQLRTIFTGSQEINEKYKNYIIDRISRALSGNASIKIKKPPFLLMNCLPLSYFQNKKEMDLDYFKHNFPLLPYGRHPEISFKWNLDGLLICDSREAPPVDWYTQFSKFGALEFLQCFEVDNSNQLSITNVNKMLQQLLKNTVNILKDRGYEPPFAFSLSLVGVKGLSLWLPNNSMLLSLFNSFRGNPAFDREIITLPEIIINSDTNIDQALQELLMAFWNSAGYEKPVSD